MNLKNILARRRQVAIAAVAATALAGGSAYAASSAVTAGGGDTVVSTASSTNLSTTGGVMTPVLSLTLPTSSGGQHYVIAAQGNFVNFGPSDYTRCRVVMNGTQISSVTATVGDPTQSGNMGPAGYVVPFSLTGGTNVPASGGTAVLQCWHDDSNGATPYLDGNASMWAHKTGSLKIATE
jgi:hypothetical protein